MKKKKIKSYMGQYCPGERLNSNIMFSKILIDDDLQPHGLNL